MVFCNKIHEIITANLLYLQDFTLGDGRNVRLGLLLHGYERLATFRRYGSCSLGGWCFPRRASCVCRRAVAVCRFCDRDSDGFRVHLPTDTSGWYTRDCFDRCWNYIGSSESDWNNGSWTVDRYRWRSQSSQCSPLDRIRPDTDSGFKRDFRIDRHNFRLKTKKTHGIRYDHNRNRVHHPVRCSRWGYSDKSDEHKYRCDG